MAKPTFWALGTLAVLMPTTSPAELSRGPPLLPGLMAASVWMRASCNSTGVPSKLRLNALTTPTVSVLCSPMGLPMAITFWPTSSSCESPSGNGKSSSLAASTWSKAMSSRGAVPTRRAAKRRPPLRITSIWFLSSITWKAVRMRPSVSRTKPLPVPPSMTCFSKLDSIAARTSMCTMLRLARRKTSIVLRSSSVSRAVWALTPPAPSRTNRAKESAFRTDRVCVLMICAPGPTGAPERRARGDALASLAGSGLRRRPRGTRSPPGEGCGCARSHRGGCGAPGSSGAPGRRPRSHRSKGASLWAESTPQQRARRHTTPGKRGSPAIRDPLQARECRRAQAGSQSGGCGSAARCSPARLPSRRGTGSPARARLEYPCRWWQSWLASRSLGGCFQLGFHFRVPLPDGVDGRIDNQLHDERGEDAADHGGGDALHYVGAGAHRPHDGQQGEEYAGHRHQLRPQPLDGAVDDGFPQVVPTAHLPFLPGVLVGQVEVEHHEDAGCRVHAQQGDEAHPDGDAHVVAEQVEQPDGAHRRKRHGQQDEEGLHHRAGVEIEQQEDHEQGDGHDQLQPRVDALHVLVLAAPLQLVADGDRHLFLHRPLGVADVAADVAPGDVHVDVAA